MAEISRKFLTIPSGFYFSLDFPKFCKMLRLVSQVSDYKVFPLSVVLRFDLISRDFATFREMLRLVSQVSHYKFFIFKMLRITTCKIFEMFSNF